MHPQPGYLIVLALILALALVLLRTFFYFIFPVCHSVHFDLRYARLTEQHSTAAEEELAMAVIRAMMRIQN